MCVLLCGVRVIIPLCVGEKCVICKMCNIQDVTAPLCFVFHGVL